MGTRLLRWLTPSWPLSLCVIAFWLLMTDSYSTAQFALALLLGWLIPRFAARLDREYARIGSLRPVPRMLCVVAWDILRSNVIVAMQVLGPERRLHPGFIWIPLDIQNLHGIAALTSMITLTPGTVSAALTDDRRYLLVHMLDMRSAQEAIDNIKTRYEKPLMEIFP
ncbi:Na+/H+ antiporter subunit E [Pseudoxanthomonas winnipegensis]|uniref:Na+/H+ antiporter subunit E n=1 Tax=Pseudoxanthomonas winnipegensis TaxID=2480810 RepID=A0A4Q8LKT4_9GAMM|nr:Na+/H+ antiporter subunit E [Pseudoxanthomonas winnipegensis]RZZ82580.1 Na+/H+ antiporter subunit E [Pseudoxanthomonas winnipegensis]TAA30539.1 Na+/H+ antiporter subunit E [Pseudoxanthomonas winnipegensis]